MGIGKGKTDYLLSLIREGKQMTLGQQLRLTAYLSVPAIMAQISSIAMQYIDASMVGSLGANAAASIGLVSTTTWLFWGVCAAAATGFSVQVAHRIGAGDFVEAKKILRQAVTATLVFSSLLAVGGICISGMLPLWLGGIFGIDALFLVNTKNSIFVMRITVVYFVNVTCTYSSILVKWVSFISGYTNISILVFL